MKLTVLAALEPVPLCNLKLMIAVPAKAAEGTKRIEKGPRIMALPAEAGLTVPRMTWVKGPPVAPWVRSTMASSPAERIWLEAGTLMGTALMLIE